MRDKQNASYYRNVWTAKQSNHKVTKQIFETKKNLTKIMRLVSFIPSVIEDMALFFVKIILEIQNVLIKGKRFP